VKLLKDRDNVKETFCFIVGAMKDMSFDAV
jgi:hypothetical protein